MSQFLAKLRSAVSLLEESMTVLDPLESMVWKVDKTTRLGIFQSREMPRLPDVPAMLVSLRKCMEHHEDPMWVQRRKGTEVELYHDLVRALRTPALAFTHAVCTTQTRNKRN